MNREELMVACTSDLAGKTRGKAFPAAELDSRLRSGIGWTPTNVQITCFDHIADSPFGALGDLLLMPDADTLVRAVYDMGEPPESFLLGDIVEMDGSPWPCCTRGMLKRALARLGDTGYQLYAAFEHEFHFRGAPLPAGSAYTLAGFRQQRAFAEALTVLMRQNNLVPDTFMKEYGPDQYEVTTAPAIGVRAADEAVMLREMVRGLAEQLQPPGASFTPLRTPGGVGNGVHIHFSLRDTDGRPASHDASQPNGLSPALGSFAAGVLRHLPDIVALTAPSVLSYTRLTPHRWSAPYNNLGLNDREAGLRICPLSDVGGTPHSDQFNLEFRASDAAASPHLQLAAIVHAGVDGMQNKLPAPTASSEDLSEFDEATLAARGIERLPASLNAALMRLDASTRIREWFDEPFVDVYLAHKRGELAWLADKSEAEICHAYEATY